MTRTEINNLLIKKRKQLNKWNTFKTKNYTFIYPLDLLLSIAFIIIGAVMCADSILIALGVFFIIVGIFLLIMDIVFWCIYATNRKKAPYMYDKTKEEIEDLQKQLAKTINDQNNAVTSSNIDALLKYKQLLDAGVISQAEFEAKKRELL